MLEKWKFWEKPNKEEADFVLEERERQKEFPLGGVVAKAVLITLLVFGSLGAFLSAYGISYNISMCVLVIFGLSLCYGLAYAGKRKWVINLLLLVSLALYFMFAYYSYWKVNSGYYSILNHIMEDARSYLGIYNGTEYQLAVENEYLAVTYFVIFIGVIGALLFSIHFAKSVSIMRVLLFTFPFYIIPMYFEKNPSVVYLIMLLASYGMVAMMRAVKKGEKPLGQFGYLLGMAVLLGLCIRLFIWMVPRETYQVYAGRNEIKRQSEKLMTGLVQSGMTSFWTNSGNAGMSGGQLGNGSVSPDYETDLVVEYTPYSYNPVYLKSFVGTAYDGKQWIPYGEYTGRAEDDFFTRETLTALKDDTNSTWGKMVVTNVGAGEGYDFYPYYTDVSASNAAEDGSVEHTYYPLLEDVSVRTSKVDDVYLEVPDRCFDAVAEICQEAGFSGDEQTIANQVVAFFQENYFYTLNPGYNWGGADYISHFLKNSRRGYCMHFASAGTMMFRYLGIPARYVEGYVFSYNDVLVDGELVENVAYADYYNGRSELGETGLIRLEIPDANAHAWVEIYVEGKGWVVVDPTPAASPEESESFWDTFRQRNRETENAAMLGADAQEYLEQVFDGAAGVLLILAVALVLALAVRMAFRKYRERKLTPRERVQMLYRDVVRQQTKKHGELFQARTIKEQLELFASYDKIGEVEQPLYRAFYGEGMTDEEYEKLYRRLKQIKRK